MPRNSGPKPKQTQIGSPESALSLFQALFFRRGALNWVWELGEAIKRRLHSCMNACMHTCTHIHIHACMHAYIWMRACTHTCVTRMHVYLRHACACMFEIHTHPYMHAYLRTCMHACSQLHTYITTLRAHLWTCRNTSTPHTYVHACTRVRLSRQMNWLI